MLLFGFVAFFYFPFSIHNKKFDIIIIDESTVWLPFALTLKLLNVPLVLDVRTLPIDKEKSILFDITIHLSKDVVDGITTITPELEEYLRKRYTLQDKRFGIWASGVSIGKFANFYLTTDNIATLRNSNVFTLIYHGTYSSTRGIENLIRSLGELDIDIKKKTMLLIIGFSQKEKENILELCERLAVTDQVKFIPQVPYEQIPSYISIADVGVYPLPPENNWWRVSAPLKTLEYLASGKPVIITNIPFHKRIFEKGECGVILDTNNPKDLASAIRYLYENKGKLTNMGKRGREIVQKYHTWEHEALELEKFLQTIIERN